MAESKFPTRQWYDVRDACAWCLHAAGAHNENGCTATVNVREGGRSWATSKSTGGPMSGVIPGAVSYSYPCPCKLIRPVADVDA